MCAVSIVMDGFNPLIPKPVPFDPGPPWAPPPGWPPGAVPMPAQPWGPVPSTGLPINPEDLRTLIDAFYKAVEAAKVADKAAGQPDCVDPEKRKLEDRVAELERRLDAMTAAGAKASP